MAGGMGISAIWYLKKISTWLTNVTSIGPWAISSYKIIISDLNNMKYPPTKSEQSISKTCVNRTKLKLVSKYYVRFCNCLHESKFGINVSVCSQPYDFRINIQIQIWFPFNESGPYSMWTVCYSYGVWHCLVLSCNTSEATKTHNGANSV